MLGVALAETLARPTGRRIVRRPARFVLVAEIVVLVIVGALPPQVPDQVVTAAIAFMSALQVSTFRSLRGIDCSSTLTTSNLRTLVAKAYLWCADHDATARRQAARIGAVVAGFGVGAAVGALAPIFWSSCGVDDSGHAGPRARRHRHGNGDPLPPKAVRGSMRPESTPTNLPGLEAPYGIETIDDHSDQDNGPGRTAQRSHSHETERGGASGSCHGGYQVR